MISVLDSGAEPSLVCMPFLPAKWRDRVRPIHKISLKAGSSRPVNVIGKVLLFFSWFVKGTFFMERRIVPFGLAQWQTFQNI